MMTNEESGRMSGELLALAAVRLDGLNLQYARRQTEEMRLLAVRKDGGALEYVRGQTLEICLAAVRQKGRALAYVKEQTPEICLAAVRKDGGALEYVRGQTPEICLAAVRRNGRALQFVPEESRTAELCLEAARRNGGVLRLLAPRGGGLAHFEDNFKAFIQQDGFTLELAYELLAAPLDEARKNRLNAFLAKKTLALWEKEVSKKPSPQEQAAFLFGDFTEEVAARAPSSQETFLKERTPPPILPLSEDEIDAMVEAAFAPRPGVGEESGFLFPLDTARTSFALTAGRVRRRVFALFEGAFSMIAARLRRALRKPAGHDYAG
jgi:hypothetical protein